MDARTIISKLRDQIRLSKDELAWFADGLASGDVSDAQAGAFAMATCIRGLSEGERVALTLAMRDSGDVMTWDVSGPVIDKHSTGGVGDCVSLLLAPALASLGVFVPMVSGRGLGHTGGTLDKLEAIPGLKTEVSEDRFKSIVGGIGTAIVSATGRIAPADKRLYAIRDVTSTVQSVDLITASILSKKLASGLGALVLDVKVGSGAFMKSAKDAEELAKSLVDTANGAGCKTSALITDMNQPLAAALGNSLEVVEVMKVLTGQSKDTRLEQITCALGGELLMLAGVTNSVETGQDMISGAIDDGRAAEKFGQMVHALGGSSEFCEDWQTLLPQADYCCDVYPNEDGYVQAIDGEKLGMTVVHLGGGRLRASDQLNYAVGLSDVAMIGAKVDHQTPIARIHAKDASQAEAAKLSVLSAFDISDEKPIEPPLIYRSIR